ncbi:hypothetical protein T06_1903 [Trichinella sp. T6]|nr:hypothetical protein T06_1903 [Trichinella sp. T6]
MKLAHFYLNNGDREKWKCVRHVEQNIPLIFMTFSTVFLSKTDCSMAIGNILQHGRRIGIQCLRSLDRYTPNMEFNVHKRRLFHEELGKALVEPEMMRRETLSRTAAAKTAVEGCDKNLTSHIQALALIPTEVVKKGASCQLCVSSDIKTSVRCQKCQKYNIYQQLVK